MDCVTRDYMKIEYAGGSNLYVLATQLDTLQKYASGEAAKVPKLNKSAVRNGIRRKHGFAMR